MVRVGGGWDTLEHFLDKHDPCRCGNKGNTRSFIKKNSVSKSSKKIKERVKRGSRTNVTHSRVSKRSRIRSHRKYCRTEIKGI